MKIDLQDNIQRLFAQEYVNAMLSSQSDEELDMMVHKFIHTGHVVDVAQELIKLSRPSLKKNTQKAIIDAALLHDIGCIKQFVNAKFSNEVGHAKLGAEFLKNIMSDENISIETNRWHCSSPSENDLQHACFYLNYVRDADILAHVMYKSQFMDKVAKNNRLIGDDNTKDLYIDPEVEAALKERRAVRYKDLKHSSFLTNMLSHLHWKFNLRLKVSKEYAQAHKIFVHFRDALVYHLIPMFYATDQEKRTIIQKILDLYTDDILNEL